MLSTTLALFAFAFAFIMLMLYVGIKGDITDIKRQLKRLKPGLVSHTSEKLPVSPKPSLHGVEPLTPEQAIHSGVYDFEQQSIEKLRWLWQKTIGWFFSGNYIAKLGVLIFLIGIVFLIKFATEYGFLSIEWRLSLAGVAGLALLVIGWRMRTKRSWYASLLMGAGVGIMYITVYGAFAMYHLIPGSLAVILLIILSLGSGGLAVLMDTQRLALLAIFAGFLAPILASSGSGNYLVLFSYFLALNLGVAYVACYKSWRKLNLVSFGLTFILSGLWGFGQFAPDKYLSTQGFLIAFIVLYTAVLIFFSRQQQETDWFDRILALGIPILGFTYQALIVQQFAYGLAFAALGFAAYYTFLAWYLSRYIPTISVLLRELMIAFATIFITLVIPFALSGEWIGVAWALEGGLVIWIGKRQQKISAVTFGLLLLLAANYFAIPTREMLTIAVFAIANYIGAYLLASYQPKWRQFWLVTLCVIFAVAIIWNMAFIYQIMALYRDNVTAQLYYFIKDNVGIFNDASSYIFDLITVPCVGFLTLIASYTVIWLCYEKWRWMYLCGLVISSAVTYPIFLLTIMFIESAVIIDLMIFIPLLVFGFAFWIQNRWLKRVEQFSIPYAKLIHIPIMVTIILFVTWWTKLLMLDFLGMPHSLENLIYGLVPAIVLLAFTTQKINRLWMVTLYPKQYYGSVGFLLVLYLLFWLLFQNLYASRVHLLPFFMPILNLKDIVSLIAILSITLWLVNKRNLAIIKWEQSSLQLLIGFFSFVVFLWINAVLLRSLAIYLDLNPFHLFKIQVVQMSLSILWAVCALVVIITAHMKQWRKFWIAGSIIIGLIIVKLVLIDFSESNTVERIVSFISVGLLLLITGYFAPIPPKASEGSHAKKDLLSK